MSNTNWKNSSIRNVQKNGKTYESKMYWYGAGDPTVKLTKTSNAEREILCGLLLDMRKKLLLNAVVTTSYPMPASFCRRAIACPGTIVDTTVGKCNYRIDNQTSLAISDPDPRLNIQYQIAKKSHAMVLVRISPIACPSDIESGFIDEEQSFGLSPITVMEFIEYALVHSTRYKCFTYIEWMITEVERDRSRSRSGSRNPSRDTSRNVLKECVATTAATANVGDKITTAQLTSVAVKKIPLIGLGCATVFGVGRLINGDPLGAFCEVFSGAASCVPGPGTAVSFGVDAFLLGRDVKK